jgi:glycosyltransferase involved in cell wall biosynthesis
MAAFMDKLTGSDITIAITVYDRQKYVRDAVRSALAQQSAERPNVIVVEDCGPDATLRESITNEFGKSIEYFRNPRRRGLFDNWNVCIEACRTPWLCILHDDDSLEPTFVEAMIELAAAAPGRALYYGLADVVDAAGEPLESRSRSTPFAWNELDLEEWARYDPVCFPAQLFNVTAARSLGGFRPTSRYCADWEMWFKLTLNYGAAATNRVVAAYREHHSIGRGTSDVDVSGRKYAYVNIQHKRHLAWLRQKRPGLRFDRKALQARAPMPTRFLLKHAHGFSPRMLRYNAGLLFLSSAPHAGYYLFQLITRLFSWRSLGFASSVFNLFEHAE